MRQNGVVRPPADGGNGPVGLYLRRREASSSRPRAGRIARRPPGRRTREPGVDGHGRFSDEWPKREPSNGETADQRLDHRPFGTPAGQCSGAAPSGVPAGLGLVERARPMARHRGARLRVWMSRRAPELFRVSPTALPQGSRRSPNRDVGSCPKGRCCGTDWRDHGRDHTRGRNIRAVPLRSVGRRTCSLGRNVRSVNGIPYIGKTLFYRKILWHS